jgi:hypothetical protein
MRSTSSVVGGPSTPRERPSRSARRRDRERAGGELGEAVLEVGGHRVDDLARAAGTIERLTADAGIEILVRVVEAALPRSIYVVSR